MQIQIPFNYLPREYQIPLLKAIDSGITRAVVVAHRRWGKDKTLINLVAKKMIEKVGTYFYFFPTYNQGKKILWNGIDKDGFKFLDHIPQELRVRESSQEMLIELKNGSIFQIIGTDNVDSIVGTNPIGCVFSEYALQDPIAWGYIRPILAENGGWAVFNFTSRGKNHGYDLVKYAKTQPDWFVQISKATDTDVFTPEQLEKEREQYLMEDGDDLRFEQEYMCSFEGSMQGSYYGKLIEQASKENRITNVPYEPQLPVYTVWDIGIGDSTAIWFLQKVGKEIRIIDYLEANGEGLLYYVNELKDKGYTYEKHFMPHDIDVDEIGTGVSRKSTAESLGLRPIEVIPKLTIEEGISSVRLILPRVYFDAEKCKRGLECLRQYHKEFDEKNKYYKNSPKHDWSSHGADAFRYLATAVFKFIERQSQVQRTIPKQVIRKW
jgi:hypothetical protein